MRARLRVPPRQLRAYSDAYSPSGDPDLSHITRAARAQGYLTSEQLHEIARWKSKRRPDLVLANPPAFVREATAFAFNARHEYSRMYTLVMLSGIQYPTASVVLHFCVRNNYPILDFRALWSLGIQQPTTYTPQFWVEYTQLCRSLPRKHGLTVRQFDRALWQYSHEHQGDA